MPSSLEGAWIEVFKAGDYGERGRWAPEQLDQLAAAYDPRLHAAPVVLGHPADDAPAYAWVKRLRRAGQSLWAQLEKVDPLFEALLRAGRFAQRSVALYTHFPATGGPYLRHLGFLGAAPPAVKGLAPVRFAESPAVSFEFSTGQQPATGGQGIRSDRPPATGHRSPSLEDAMPESKSKLEGFLDHLRAFFTPSGSEGFAPETSPPPVIPLALSGAEGSDPESRIAGRGGVEGPAFSERLAALEQRLDTLTGSSSEPVTPSDPERNRGGAEGSLLAHQQITTFIDSLRARGRFPPAYERWGVADFMERLAAADTAAAANSLSFRAEPVLGEPIQREAEGRSRGISFSTKTSLAPNGSGLGMTQEEESPQTSEGKEQPTESLPSLLAWFQEFLTRLPAVIEFQELGDHGSRVASHLSRPVVRFAEPHRGMSIDLASVELAERAEALAAELGISYAQALTRLREERRRTVTTA